MTTRVEIQPDILERAIKRAGFIVDEFLLRYPKVGEWLTLEKQPTVKQLEKFSKDVRIPFGYLLLDELPEEKVPIPFFRTGSGRTDNVSLAIYDTILLLKNRQTWLSDYLKDNEEEPLDFVGKYDVNTDYRIIVEDMRRVLQLPENWANDKKDWNSALNHIMDTAEEAGIVITVNGVYDNNNTRPIDPKECRGFVLIDDYVPFLFVNNKDAKAAQMFTLAHELVHIWLGFSAGFDMNKIMPADDPIELLCDKAAAEFLVPEKLFRQSWETEQNFKALAKIFRVSPIVIGRRALDLGLVSQGQFFQFYRKYMDNIKKINEKRKDAGGGGNYYATMRRKVSPRFFGYVNSALYQGDISHLEAYRLTSMKGKTYNSFVEKTMQQK